FLGASPLTPHPPFPIILLPFPADPPDSKGRVSQPHHITLLHLPRLPPLPPPPLAAPLASDTLFNPFLSPALSLYFSCLQTFASPQILLTAKGVSLNPITSLYYISPVCLLFLSIPWLLVEYPRLAPSLTIPAQPALVLFLANCACAFSLNLAVFLLIGKTSALTMNVAGT
ncbi:unnamed protein product, partial [Closterium sp. NIES-53]